MTREELLELAPLDAFGLLDEVEAALFHRAFHQAPPSVQDEVIALQAELVAADHFLSDDEPRPILRRKVLLRLEEVMDESAEELRPIAQIGSRGPEATGRGVRGQAGPGGAEGDGKGLRGLANPANPDAVADLESLATFRSLMEEFAERNARSAARTTPFWRAAAIVLGTALVVSLYMLRDTSEHAKKISELVIAQGIERQIGDLVPDLQARLAAGARCLSMVPAADMSGGLASAALVVDAAPAR